MMIVLLLLRTHLLYPVVILNKLIFLAKRSIMRANNLSTGNRGGIIITHREFITDIQPTSDFVKLEYALNPGLYQVTPWLADLASQYEEYECRAMVFEYKSLCSDTTSTSNTLGLGSVIMATNYNPLNNPFVDKRTMENYEYASSKKPTQSNIHVIDVKRSSTPVPGLKWVRSSLPPPNADIRLYDMGTFTIATQGQPSTVLNGVIGELWVAYEFEFFKPKYVTSLGSNLLNDHYSFDNSHNFGQHCPFTESDHALNNPLSPNGVATLGTRIIMNDVTSDTGYDTIRFNATHQGMTMLLIATYAGVARDSSVALETFPSPNVEEIKAFEKQETAFSRTNSGMNNFDTVTFIMKLKVKPVVQTGTETNLWDLSFRFANNTGNMPITPYLDILILQINGTPEIINNNNVL